jgi:hypothetical protein
LRAIQLNREQNERHNDDQRRNADNTVRSKPIEARPPRLYCSRHIVSFASLK